jgi:DNA-binding XRE family transcriptional regulator
MPSNLVVLCEVPTKHEVVTRIDDELAVKFVELLVKLDHERRVVLLELAERFEDAMNCNERLDLAESMLGVLSTVAPPIVSVPIAAVPESDEAGLQRYRSMIGRRLVKLRSNLGWTQSVVAEKTGIQQSHISRIEAGRVSPSFLTIRRLAKAFGVAPGQIDPNYPDD